MKYQNIDIIGKEFEPCKERLNHLPEKHVEVEETEVKIKDARPLLLYSSPVQVVVSTPAGCLT